MSRSPTLYPLSFVRKLLAGDQLNADDLARGGNLDSHDLLDKNWVPAEDFLAIISNIKRVADCGHWGFDIGRNFHHAALGAHGYAVMAAPNLREALRLVVSYNTLTSPMCQTLIEEGEQSVSIILQLSIDASDLNDGLMDMAMCLTYRMLCAPFPIAKDQITVFYQRAAPSYCALLKDLYGKVQFQSAHYGFKIPTTIYEWDSPLHEPSVWKAAEQACYRQLSLLDFRDRLNIIPIVEERINASINENYRSGIYRPLVTLEQVADYMETKEFTLRKELSHQAHSFRKIKEQCRQQWLERLLCEPALSLQTIGLILGYTEHSNFARACKQWSGHSPKTLRAQALL